MRTQTLPLALLLALLPAGAAFSEPEKLPASQRMQDGASVYRSACARCHDSGADGAPLIGQQQAWKGRSDLWEAVLFEHAEKGYLGMPAGGGDSRLSQYDIEAAAEYMVQTSHPELPAD